MCAFYGYEVKFTRLLLLALPLFLVAVPAAEAQKPVPGIQQTAQWKSMKQYVAFLQSQSSTPASQAQKEVFTSTLAAKQTATNNRVSQLYSQKINRIQARDQRAEKKQIRKIRAQEKSGLAQIQRERSARINKEKARWSAQQASTRASYALQITTAQNTISKLRRNLRKTNNPFARQVILARIDAAQNTVDRLRNNQQRTLQKQRAAYKENLSSIRSLYALKLSSARNHYDNLVREVQTTWKKLYKSDVRAAKSNRQRQFQLVSSLRQQGNTAIAAIPISLGSGNLGS